MTNDTSLMNPKYLSQEIVSLEDQLRDGDKTAHAIKSEIDEILEILAPLHQPGQPITLTNEQATKIVGLLSVIDLHRWRYYVPLENNLAELRRLRHDRRWFIGSKLTNLLYFRKF